MRDKAGCHGRDIPVSVTTLLATRSSPPVANGGGREASVKRERESEFSARFLSERRWRHGARVSAAERQKRARQQRIRILQENWFASFWFYSKTQVKLPNAIWLGKRTFTFGHAGSSFHYKTRVTTPVAIFPNKRIVVTS